MYNFLPTDESLWRRNLLNNKCYVYKETKCKNEQWVRTAVILDAWFTGPAEANILSQMTTALAKSSSKMITDFPNFHPSSDSNPTKTATYPSNSNTQIGLRLANPTPSFPVQVTASQNLAEEFVYWILLVSKHKAFIFLFLPKSLYQMIRAWLTFMWDVNKQPLVLIWANLYLHVT